MDDKYGTVQPTKYVGYIRTQCFSKAIGMFPRANIVHLVAERGVQRERKVVVHRGYITRETLKTDQYTINWKGKERSGLFGLDPIDQHDEISELIAGAKLGDFVIERIQYAFENPSVVDILNEMVLKTCAGKKVEKIIAREKLYATFESYCEDDLKTGCKYARLLNQKEINELGFRIATLDLVDLHTGRMEKYGEKEKIDLEGNADLIRHVLKSLNWDGWPVESRKVENEGVVETPKPCAIRVYKLSEKKKWELVTEEESNG